VTSATLFNGVSDAVSKKYALFLFSFLWNQKFVITSQEKEREMRKTVTLMLCTVLAVGWSSSVL